MPAQPFKFALPKDVVPLSHLLKLVLLPVALCCSSFAQTPTTISLALTSAGAAVAATTAGSMVTLTASVVAGSTAVNPGQVNFCDATAAYCTDTHLLGTAQLNSAGQATLHLRPASGSYSYIAEFLGTSKTATPYASSTSNVVTLTVTGPIATAATVTQSGSPGSYTLNASVYGFTKSNTAVTPTGTVSFLDASTNNSTLGMATLAPSSNGPFWVNVSNPAVGGAGPVVAADFNADGNLDLAVGVNATNLPYSVAILLGDGQGNFTRVTSGLINVSGSPALVQDFNGDGIPDLLLYDPNAGEPNYPFQTALTVLLGNGDGTFTQAPGTPPLSEYPGLDVVPLASADFNRDGIPDLAVASSSGLIILLGNGDGTFTQVSSSTAPGVGGDSANSIAIADFNGDGIPDLATFGPTNNVVVFLGNGDGTFSPGPSTPLPPQVGGIMTTADFNQDGKPDLAVSGSGYVVVLLGNGDGTFQTASTISLATTALVNRVAVGDFNGDGLTDLFVGVSINATNVFVFLGNGDGTFAGASTNSANLPCCSPTVFADFNGDGVTDIVSSEYGYGLANVFLTAMQQSSAATTTAISVSGPTPQQAIASYSGDGAHSPSQSASTPLLVQAAAPAFTPASGILPAWQSITLASATPGVAIYYQATGSALQTNGFVSYTGPIFVSSLGNVTIQAYATEFNYGQSQTISATYTIAVANPAPLISSISPPYANAGTQPSALTIIGSGFTPVSGVYWNNTAVGSQYLSPTEISVPLDLSYMLNSSGAVTITVQNPLPGGGKSNAFEFEFDTGGPGTSPVFLTSNATVAPGSSASYRVTLPSFASNVSVSCLNLPAGASCSYSNNPSVLKIATSSTTPSGSYQVTAVFNETVPVTATAVVLSPLLLVPFAGLKAKRKRKSALALAVLAVALPLFALSGCGGGGGNSTGGGTMPTQQVTSSGAVTLIVQ